MFWGAAMSRNGRCLTPEDTATSGRPRIVCADCDGLESGQDEAFWRPIEAGGPSRREEILSGKRQQAADRFEPQMLD
jgi:hypothetical protein